MNIKMFLHRLRFVFYTSIHPFKGNWELKHEGEGSLITATVIYTLLVLTTIFRRQYTGYLFNYNILEDLNIYLTAFSVLVPIVLWCVSNWCLTTLMDGKGGMKDIYTYTAYAFMPMVLINVILIIISHLIVLDEASLYYFFDSLSTLWSGALVILGTMVVHEYSMKKTLLSCLLIIVGMGIMIFIALLFFNVIQQMYGFVYVIYNEIALRIS